MYDTHCPRCKGPIMDFTTAVREVDGNQSGPYFHAPCFVENERDARVKAEAALAELQRNFDWLCVSGGDALREGCSWDAVVAAARSGRLTVKPA